MEQLLLVEMVHGVPVPILKRNAPYYAPTGSLLHEGGSHTPNVLCHGEPAYENENQAFDYLYLAGVLPGFSPSTDGGVSVDNIMPGLHPLTPGLGHHWDLHLQQHLGAIIDLPIPGLFTPT